MYKAEEFKKFVSPAPYEPCKENCNICKTCAQERPVCCQCFPCYISPHDLKDLSFEGIIGLLETGAVSIDWYETDGESRHPELRVDGDVPHLFLRMRGAKRKVVDPAFGLTCCALWDKNKGCPLEFGYRPKGARELIPNPKIGDESCASTYEKDDCAVEWDPYKGILDKATEYFISSGDFERYDPLDMLLHTLEELYDLEELAYEKGES